VQMSICAWFPWSQVVGVRAFAVSLSNACLNGIIVDDRVQCPTFNDVVRFIEVVANHICEAYAFVARWDVFSVSISRWGDDVVIHSKIGIIVVITNCCVFVLYVIICINYSICGRSFRQCFIFFVLRRFFIVVVLILVLVVVLGVITMMPLFVIVIIVGFIRGQDRLVPVINDETCQCARATAGQSVNAVNHIRRHR
jgi:hypothetical protein